MKSDLVVAEERGFRFQHGPVARGLAEFRDIVAGARPPDVFCHKDHYAAWLREVLQELPLARRLDAYAASPPAPDVYKEIVVDLVSGRLTSRGSP